MLTARQTNLRPLLESKDGIHLTIYLINRGDLADIKMQLRGFIDETYEWLNNVQSVEEQEKFIEPLEKLLSENSILKQITGNVAIFRNKNSMRVLNIPIEIETGCHVATSFHIKPLLRWLQGSQIENTLREFRFAEEGNRTKKNIFQIAKAVVRGKVKKLIVTDEINIFGKIDYKTGGLAIHPFDIDHEDDCILDDLAQLVLTQGGEVIVAKRSEIPKGRPILAILDDGPKYYEKIEELNFGDLREPFR